MCLFFIIFITIFKGGIVLGCLVCGKLILFLSLQEGVKPKSYT